MIIHNEEDVDKLCDEIRQAIMTDAVSFTWRTVDGLIKHNATTDGVIYGEKDVIALSALLKDVVSAIAGFGSFIKPDLKVTYEYVGDRVLTSFDELEQEVYPDTLDGYPNHKERQAMADKIAEEYSDTPEPELGGHPSGMEDCCE